MSQIQQYIYDDVSKKIKEMIEKNESFVLRGLDGKMSEVISQIESTIEDQKMTCRIYSRNRAAVVTASAFVPFLGWANLAAIATHNLATYDPDYEIGKDLIDKRLYVTYKR